MKPGGITVSMSKKDTLRIVLDRYTHGSPGRRLLMGLLLLAVSCIALPCLAQDRYPQRIISLGPTITEKLYILGVEERIVGVTTYCVRPVRATEKEKIGNVTNIRLEKVVRLRPDLVVATSLTGIKVLDQLKRLGLRTAVFGDPRSFEEMNKQFLELGRIVGKEAKAEEIVRATERRVASIRRATGNLDRPKVFVQVGARPLFAATGTSFINDFVEFAGGINVAAHAKSGFYNREEVVLRNPDVIVIVTMGITAAEEKKVWGKFTGLSAVKSGRMLIMDPYKVCSPTPLTFVETLQEFTKALHGALPFPEERV
jgi:iron complex transport system substrate-binding protein